MSNGSVKAADGLVAGHFAATLAQERPTFTPWSLLRKGPLRNTVDAARNLCGYVGCDIGEANQEPP
jgi:hypothetical protein